MISSPDCEAKNLTVIIIIVNLCWTTDSFLSLLFSISTITTTTKKTHALNYANVNIVSFHIFLLYSIHFDVFHSSNSKIHAFAMCIVTSQLHTLCTWRSICLAGAFVVRIVVLNRVSHMWCNMNCLPAWLTAFLCVCRRTQQAFVNSTLRMCTFPSKIVIQYKRLNMLNLNLPTALGAKIERNHAFFHH